MDHAEKGCVARSCCANLLRCNEGCAHPLGLRTIDEVRGQTATIIHPSCADDPYWLTGEWGAVALYSVDNGRNKDRHGDITHAAHPSPTCAHEVNAGIESFLDMLWIANRLRENEDYG